MKLAILIAGIILIAGCIQPGQQQVTQNSNNVPTNQIDQAETPGQICIDKCNQLLASGINLTSGPCLLNPIENTTWVCDVAHNPRAAVDDNPQNQCSSYLEKANHFVEVTPGCEFIRAV